jgi:hypothetical protein
LNPLNPFQALASAAPAFTQPILPGWTLNIDSNNSSSPRTEGLVVARFSYGSQLGRLNDALEAIVATLPAATRDKPAVERFLAMKRSIDVLKGETLDSRVRALAEELRALKSSPQRRDEKRFAAASAPLRALFEEDDRAQR